MAKQLKAFDTSELKSKPKEDILKNNTYPCTPSTSVLEKEVMKWQNS